MWAEGKWEAFTKFASKSLSVQELVDLAGVQVMLGVDTQAEDLTWVPWVHRVLVETVPPSKVALKPPTTFEDRKSACSAIDVDGP